MLTVMAAGALPFTGGGMVFAFVRLSPSAAADKRLKGTITAVLVTTAVVLV